MPKPSRLRIAADFCIQHIAWLKAHAKQLEQCADDAARNLIRSAKVERMIAARKRA